MDEAEQFVRSQFPTVGSVVLYPNLLENYQKAGHIRSLLPKVKRKLVAAGWLTEAVLRNTATGEMEHRIERTGA